MSFLLHHNLLGVLTESLKCLPKFLLGIFFFPPQSYKMSRTLLGFLVSVVIFQLVSSLLFPLKLGVKQLSWWEKDIPIMRLSSLWFPCLWDPPALVALHCIFCFHNFVGLLKPPDSYFLREKEVVQNDPHASQDIFLLIVRLTPQVMAVLFDC